jgi:phospholipid/cholesterol/gamma-HCH transport system permease protein
MMALMVAMPLLTIYSNILGMLGGGAVALSMDITFTQYVHQLSGAFGMSDVMTGVFKSLVFAILISFAGCRAGFNCGRSSAAVGNATTSAVVTAIVYLVVADAGLNIIYFQLGI